MSSSLMRVEPSSELVFDVENGRLDEAQLKLTNTSPHRLGYKVFTDHNDLYLVQPKSGFVEKNASVPVSVKLQRVPDQPTAVDHTTVIKARVAKDDEIDRDKEWRTATPDDEARMQIVRLKSRFRTTKSADEDVATSLRRIQQHLAKIDEKIDTTNSVCRMTFVLGAIMLVLILVGLFD